MRSLEIIKELKMSEILIGSIEVEHPVCISGQVLQGCIGP
jgi:hypothetical protein